CSMGGCNRSGTPQMMRDNIPTGRGKGAWAAALAVTAILAAQGGPAAGQNLTAQSYTNADGLPQQQVLTLHQDATGYLWFGTYSGASRFDGQRFRTFNLKDGLRSNAVLDFAEDTLGRLWAATEGGGLCRFDGEKFHCMGTEAGLPSNDVHAIAADPSGGLWAATAEGLAHLSQRGLQVYTAADGLPATECLTVARDATGAIWAGTSAGLARLEGSRFVPVVAEELGQRAVGVLLPTADGLVVGTDAGAYLLRDDFLTRLHLPPPL